MLCSLALLFPNFLIAEFQVSLIFQQMSFVYIYKGFKLFTNINELPLPLPQDSVVSAIFQFVMLMYASIISFINNIIGNTSIQKNFPQLGWGVKTLKSLFLEISNCPLQGMSGGPIQDFFVKKHFFYRKPPPPPPKNCLRVATRNSRPKKTSNIFIFRSTEMVEYKK